jgi:hypothetical protein
VKFFTSMAARAPVTESIEIRAANHWHRLTSAVRRPRAANAHTYRLARNDGTPPTNRPPRSVPTLLHISHPPIRPPTGETSMTGNERQILDSVLNQWRSAVDAHDYDRVAAYFTDDVIFQGLHPYSVGPKGVAEYYASQPIGMTAAYTIQETRRLAGDLVLGYLSVDFAFTDRPVLILQPGVATWAEVGR